MADEYIKRELAIIGLAASSLMPHQIDDAAEALQLVPAADVVPVVRCKDYKYNNYCLTQEVAEEESRVPFDHNTFFCADGERREREEKENG